jgi:hypothetical protein
MQRATLVHLSVAAALTGALVVTAAPPAVAGTSMSLPVAASVRQQSVPAAAMLQAEDLGGATPETVTHDYWDAFRPPQPCADRPYPSASSRGASRAVSAMVGFNDRPTVVVEDVAIYRADGARRYLRDLRRALAACDGVDERGGRWTVLRSGVAGDESLLLRHRVYIDYAETFKDTYLVVARTGRVLVTVADTGWETGDGHRAVARRLSTVAVRRAAILT